MQEIRPSINQPIDLTSNSLGYIFRLFHSSKYTVPCMFYKLFALFFCLFFAFGGFFCYWSRSISETFLYHNDSSDPLFTEINQAVIDWQCYLVARTEFCLNPSSLFYYTCFLPCVLLQADFIYQLRFFFLKNKHSISPCYEDKINVIMHMKAHFLNKCGWVLNSQKYKSFPNYRLWEDRQFSFSLPYTYRAVNLAHFLSLSLPPSLSLPLSHPSII